MLIFKKEKKKKRKKKSVRRKHKLSFGNTIGVCKRICRNPKTENPRPKSFFFVSIPIWPDTYLKKKKKKALDTNINSAWKHDWSLQENAQETPKLKTLDASPSPLSPLSSKTMSSRQRYAIKTLLYKNKNSDFIYKNFDFLFSDLLDRDVFVCFCCWNFGF